MVHYDRTIDSLLVAMSVFVHLENVVGQGLCAARQYFIHVLHSHQFTLKIAAPAIWPFGRF